MEELVDRDVSENERFTLDRLARKLHNIKNEL